MSRPNFSPTKQMDIKFTDNEGISEGAVDLGGPKREFLRLVLEYVRDHSGMFEGPQGKKVLACSIAVLTEALIFGPDKVIVSAEDVGNEEIRSQIILIRDAISEDALEDAVSKASSILALSGCFRRIDMQNRGEVAIDTASWYVLQRTRAAYESHQFLCFVQGMYRGKYQYKRFHLEARHSTLAETFRSENCKAAKLQAAAAQPGFSAAPRMYRGKYQYKRFHLEARHSTLAETFRSENCKAAKLQAAAAQPGFSAAPSDIRKRILLF
ncbi:UNVERIFIED_CONTAM: hypothetical protein FKN15_063428 [Acipenser sinensis]